MASFCKEAGCGSELIEDQFNSMVDNSSSCAAYLGEFSLTMDKLFEMLSSFIASYKAAQKEHTRLIKVGDIGVA